MKSKHVSILASAVLLPLAGAFVFWGTGRAHRNPEPGSSESGAPARVSIDLAADKALPPFQTDLLDLAFTSASALPSNPHIKNRSRAQEAVVAACLDLDQPRRALRHAEKMDTWRRGAAYADLAYYYATHGNPGPVQHLLDLAGAAADDLSAKEDAQDWHRDRIRSRIARTYVVLGRLEDAARIGAGVVASESGVVETARATRMAPADVDASIASIDQVLASGSLEELRNALSVCAELYGRFYEDEERRSIAAARIKAPNSNLPVPIRVELMMKLADTALDHGDQPAALALAKELRSISEASKGVPEEQIPRLARLAGLRYRVGEKDEARSDIGAALAMYEGERARIIDIYRAATLIPLGEVYRRIGEPAAAVGIYSRAVAESVVNPNSRPRAENLVAICCSMAVHGVEPDAQLMTRIRQVHDGLGSPW